MRTVRERDQAAALGHHLDRIARIHLGELLGRGEVGEIGEPGLAGLLDEDADWRLATVLSGDRLLTCRAEQHLEPVDVAFGDAIRRIEREGGLVVLARLAEHAELPQRLGEAVLRLGIGAELQQLAIGLCGLIPLRGRRLGDRLLRELALRPRQVDRGLLGGLDIGEGHGGVVRAQRSCGSFGRSEAAVCYAAKLRFRAPLASVTGGVNVDGRSGRVARRHALSGYSRMSRFSPMTATPRTASRIVCQSQRTSRRRDGLAAWKASQR